MTKKSAIIPDKIPIPLIKPTAREIGRVGETADYWGPKVFREILKDAIQMAADETEDAEIRARWLELQASITGESNNDPDSDQHRNRKD